MNLKKYTDLSSTIKMFCLLLVASQLIGCVYWRLLQTKIQLESFEQNFEVVSDDKFTLGFKNPLIFSDDLLYLSKVQPSQKSHQGNQEIWTNIFRKVDAENQLVEPEISFYWEFVFNQEQLLSAWSLSPLFLQIAPADFLEVSLRAMAGAEIFQSKRQIKADLESVDKVVSALPKRAEIEKKLGTPLTIEHRKNAILYIYRFILDSPQVEPGYEDRTITNLKLYFDKQSDALIKTSGRFVGLKIAIDYRKLVDKQAK